MPKKWIGWHFLQEDRRLQFGKKTKVRVGQTLKHAGKVVLCSSGFHASKRAIDAIGYAPGPIVCRVVLAGEIVEDTDKAVAAERTVLAMADATMALHEFSCWCAERALKTAKVEDVRCWAAIETKRKWMRGEATDQELAAARAAAWDAARDAARAAARAAQNRKLTAMLNKLLKGTP